MPIDPSELVQVLLRDVKPLEDISVRVVSRRGVEVSGETDPLLLVVLWLEAIVPKYVADVVVTRWDQGLVGPIGLKPFLILWLSLCLLFLLCLQIFHGLV